MCFLVLYFMWRKRYALYGRVIMSQTWTDIVSGSEWNTLSYSSISKTVAKGRKDSNIKKNEQKMTTNKKEKKTQKKQTHKQTKTQSLGIALIVV